MRRKTIRVDLPSRSGPLDEGSALALYYARHTALEFWRWKASTLSNILKVEPIRYVKLSGKTIHASEVIAGCEPFHDSATKACVMVAEKDQVRAHPNIEYVFCSQALPIRSLHKINRETYVSSPEFMFIQMAKVLSLIELASLGCELTGSYVVNDDDQRGFCSCDPIASKASIDRMIGNAANVPGVKKARSAANLLIENAASPMETYVALLLSLPNRLGGYGMPKPKLNHAIRLTSEQAITLKRHSIVMDLAWPSQHLAIEYESTAWHSGEQKFVQDSIRRNDIRSLGYDVTTITLNELKSIASMDRIAKSIAAKLGVRLRLERIDRNKQSALRRRLWKC